MAKQGRGGIALGIAAIGSFFAGTVSTVFVAALAIPLTSIALMFGPVEYFSLMVTGLIFAAALARGSMFNALITIVFGVLLSTIGPDLVSGKLRMTFGVDELADGIDFAVMGMGLFGIGEILRNLDHTMSRDVVKGTIGRLCRALTEIRQSLWPIIRGTVIGGALGILPGNGAVLGAFASYTVEKKLAKDPSRFGRGAIEGVAGPESANNAGAQTSFIPLLTLGIPPNAVMAIMVGAMTIHGIVPGPQVISRNPDLFWGLIASMWIGNLMLLIINLPLIGIWVRLLKVPYRLLFPAIIMFCCIGVFSINGSTTDVVIMAAFSVLGYGMSKFGFEPAPLVLGMILGRMMEESLRQSMIISGGDFTIFVTRPISAALLGLCGRPAGDRAAANHTPAPRGNIRGRRGLGCARLRRLLMRSYGSTLRQLRTKRILSARVARRRGNQPTRRGLSGRRRAVRGPGWQRSDHVRLLLRAIFHIYRNNIEWLVQVEEVREATFSSAIRFEGWAG